MKKKKEQIEASKEGEQVKTQDPQGNQDPMQELGNVLEGIGITIEAFRKQSEDLLAEVNALKAGMVSKEFVSKSVVAGIEEFSKRLVPASEEAPKGEAGGAGTNRTLSAITDLVSGLASIAKTFQPQSDPRLTQLGEMGMEFSRIAIMNSMKVQAKALGIPMHLELEQHGATG